MKAAIIGFGVMGRIHYRVLGTIPGVEIVGLCDPEAAAPGNTAWYLSAETLLAEQKPDFIIIAVPTPRHEEIALRCIENKINVLIEKPVAATVTQGHSILSAARHHGITACVGHVERFNPVVRALRNELVEKQILSISFTRVGHNPPRDTSVGVLTDLAVHDIDLIHFITGRRVTRHSIYASGHSHGHPEDNANLSFELDNGILASITTNWLTPFKRRKIEVTTDTAYYEADLVAQVLTEFSAYKDNDTFLTRACPVTKGEPLRNQLLAFIRFLEQGDAGDCASLEDSIRTLSIIDSAKTGGVIQQGDTPHE